MSNNSIATKEAGKALAQALASNSVLKELNVSSNNWADNYSGGDGPEFAKELRWPWRQWGVDEFKHEQQCLRRILLQR